MDDFIGDEELYTIVCQGDLFNELDARLKSATDIDKVLQYFYERDDQRVNLLMLGALHGHDAVIHVLLSHSSNIENFVELDGYVISANGNTAAHVTALWCACDRGHYTVARTLIKVGKAEVQLDLRNPLLIDAVVSERFDTMQFLVENNYVDIDRTQETNYPNYNSLMLSAATGQKKTVAYLLERGATMDCTTRQNDTALGCAARRGHFDIVQFLCSAGASTDIKNRDGQTPLALAFENGHSQIVDYLLDLTKNELCIEELEFLACSTIVRGRNTTILPSQFGKMVNLMEKIFHLRKERNSPKTISPPIAAYHFQQECQTLEEFEKLQKDNNRLYIEALIIRERILLPKKTIKLCEPHLIYGEKLLEQGDFEQCLYLWEHTFHLYQRMEHETCLHRFVWIFCRMILANVFIPPQLFVKICRLTFEPAEQTKKNHSIKNALCFVTIAAKVLEQPTVTKTDRQSIGRWIHDLCRQQRTTTDGQTLLHLCVNDQTYRDINYRANEVKRVLNFPNLAATQLLLSFGKRWIDLDAIDIFNGNTALHIVAQSKNPDALSIVELLIHTGAHIDCLNKHNKTAWDCAKSTEIKDCLQKYQTPSLLKCLCARQIVTQQINYESLWPSGTELNSFLYLHGCIGKQNDTDSADIFS